MRILAIRGSNLASLAEPFEIDFRREPLASAGLFAIGGPTGAGKSSLLDALCIALYRQTPRLAAAPARGDLPDVGEARINPGDPRNLLRRGAGEGRAEVDFVGNDGLEYRAAWSVRRARGRADGRLQAAERSLVRLSDGARLSDGIEEVLAAIEGRLGLSFQQFTRAVLLAQNEFFVFLKADDNERASLLETLTGTASFSDVSVRAFQRFKAEQEALQRLKDQLAGQVPLEPEARQAAEERRDAARDEANRIDARRAELESHLRWHDDLAAAVAAERQAGEDAGKAEADRAAAVPRQAILARVDAAQLARPLAAELDRAGAEVESARRIAQSAGAAHVAAAGAEEQAHTVLATATERVASAGQASAAAAPDLDRAKALDAQIEALAPGHSRAATARDEAARKLVQAQADLSAARADRQAREQELRQAQDWLGAHAALRELGERWPSWDALLKQAGKVQGEVAGAAGRVAQAGEQAERARKAATAAGTGLDAASAKIEATEAQLQAAANGLSGFDAEGDAADRQAAEARRDLLSEAARSWQSGSAAAAKVARLDAERAGLQAALADSEAGLARIAADRSPAEAARAQAERALQAAQLACAENVESLRHSLEPGQPCPVCGATEHPYAAGDARLQALLAQLRGESGRLAKAVEELVRTEAAQDAAARSARNRIGECERNLAEAREALAADTAAWEASPVSAELAGVPADGRAARLALELDRAKQRIATLAAREEFCRKALKAREEARAAHDAAAREHGIAKDTAAKARSALDRVAAELGAARDRQAETERRRDGLLEEIDGAFAASAWREQWHSGPAAFHEACRAEAGQWAPQAMAAAESAAAIATLEARLEMLDAAESAARREHQEAEASFAGVHRGFAERQEARRALFEGRPAAEVEAALRSAVESAKGEQTGAAERARLAAAERARAAEALAQATRALAAREGEFGNAQAALGAWIATFVSARPDEPALDVPSLRELLAKSPAWIAGERGVLQAIDAAAHRAQAVLAERRGQREAHEARRPAEDEAPAVRAALDHALAERRAAGEALIGCEAEIRADDERHARSGSLAEEIGAREQAVRVWAQLNELIGSADGKKFRNYAQRLTLDVLLGFANRHLVELSRRYRLQRVEGTLALVVIDQDMGDEVRSVHSLSGGETFLVSLALALGLASLSSNRVRVESLFVDEGFGSLDSETLRVAMDALDSLQAQGRKVGVISHVQEMTERIGTQIQVRKLAGGRSRVIVPGG